MWKVYWCLIQSSDVDVSQLSYLYVILIAKILYVLGENVCHVYCEVKNHIWEVAKKMCGKLFCKTKFSKFPFASLGICWSETFKLLWDSFTLTACCFEASIVFVKAHLQPLSLFLLGRSTSQSSLLSYSPNPYSTLIIETVSKGQKK